MASLSTNSSLFIKRVTDSLKTGPNYATASMVLGTGTAALKILAQDAGVLGNDITVAVTLPTVTAGLTVTVVGKAITIALDQINGTPTDANNTAVKIAAAIAASSPAAALVIAYVADNVGAGHIDAAIAAAHLAGGKGGDNSVATLPMNFLRAQDLSSVFSLLQDIMLTGTLTAVGGSATTLLYNEGAFAKDQQVGNYVTFGAATTTVALRGKTARVSNNTQNTLTFKQGALAGTPVAGDTFVISAGLISDQIAELRQGKGLADAPPGNVFGMQRQAIDAVNLLVQQLALKNATGTLTFTGQPSDTETVTINGKVYQFQDILTNVDGHVFIGASAAATIVNLVNAITLGAGSGTKYAAATTLHPTVTATGTATVVTLSAKTAGTAGNALTLTEAATNVAASGATLTGGLAVGAVTERAMGSLTTGTGSTTTSIVIAPGARLLRIDAYKGLTATISGEARNILGNDETHLLLDAALTSAPAGSVTVSLTVSDRRASGSKRVPLQVHPAGQPGNAQQLAELIRQAVAAVVAYTVTV